MMPRTLATLVLAGSCAAQTPTCHAITSGMAVSLSFTGAKTIPPNTVITNGASLTIQGVYGGIATASFSAVTASANAITFGISGSAMYGPLDQASSNLGVDVYLLSSTRIPVVVRASFYGSASSIGGGGLLSLIVGSYASHSYPIAYLSTPVERSWKAWIDPPGLIVKLVLGCNTNSYPEWGSGGCKVTVLPDAPCVASRYGSPCNMTLDVTGDFVQPKLLQFRVTNSYQPPIAWLLFGVQKTNVPFLGCWLYNEILVSAPITLNGSIGTLQIVPPPVPGIYATVQGAALLATNLYGSDGLELRCN